MVDCGEGDLGQEFGKWVRGGGKGGIAGQEDTGVSGFFDEGVRCVPVSFDGSEADGAVRVGDGVGGGDRDSTRGDGGVVYGVEVVDFEGNICFSWLVSISFFRIYK